MKKCVTIVGFAPIPIRFCSYFYGLWAIEMLFYYFCFMGFCCTARWLIFYYTLFLEGLCSSLRYYLFHIYLNKKSEYHRQGFHSYRVILRYISICEVYCGRQPLSLLQIYKLVFKKPNLNLSFKKFPFREGQRGTLGKF